MTQAHIADRNRANAAKSTGPKTRAGKAASSKNARRHGATGAPDPSRVASWLSVILDRPQVTPRDLIPADAVGDLALTLAMAEARLAAAEDALAEFEAELETPCSELADIEFMAEHIAEALAQPSTTPEERKSGADILVRAARVRLGHAKSESRRHRLLTRYARDARAARSRAIAAWSHAATSHNQTGARS
jgi:hypothetical protein